MPIQTDFFKSLEKIFLNSWSQILYNFTSTDVNIGWLAIIVFIVGAFLLLSFGIAKEYDPPITHKGPIWKRIFPRHIYGSKSFVMDIQLFFTNIFLNSAVEVFLFFQPLYFTNWVQSHVTHGPAMPPHPNLGILPTVATGASLVFFTEAAYYLTHFLFHKVPFFWEFHKVHHSATHLNIFTMFRVHWLENFMFSIFNAILMGGFLASLGPLGIFPGAYSIAGGALISLLYKWVNLYNHSHLWFSFGPFDYVFQSPAMHIIHHSQNPKHYNKNLGFKFTFFDYVFGTFYKPTRDPEQIKIGLDEDWSQYSLARMYYQPIMNIWNITAKKKLP